jgi:hypothetical protein
MEHTAGCEKSKFFSKKVLTIAFLSVIMAKPSQEKARLKTLAVVFFNHFADGTKDLEN